MKLEFSHSRLGCSLIHFSVLVDRRTFFFLTLPLDTKITVVSNAPFPHCRHAASFLFQRSIIVEIDNKFRCILLNLIGSVNAWDTAISSLTLNSIPRKKCIHLCC